MPDPVRRRREDRWDGSPWPDDRISMPPVDRGGVDLVNPLGALGATAGGIQRMPPVDRGGEAALSGGYQSMPPVGPHPMLGSSGGSGHPRMPPAMPPAMAALSALGGDRGTELSMPGQRSLPPSSRALATVAQRRPGHRIY
jgi:hypothetical protein